VICAGYPAPFDYHFTFLVLALFAFAAAVLARWFPPTIEKRIEARIRPGAAKK
jgi:hypothetical protein